AAPSAVAGSPQTPLRTSDFWFIWGSVSLPKHKRYWGTQRVARVCQVSPATVANWIDQGLLKGHKTPTGRRRVEAEALPAWRGGGGVWRRCGRGCGGGRRRKVHHTD